MTRENSPTPLADLLPSPPGISTSSEKPPNPTGQASSPDGGFPQQPLQESANNLARLRAMGVPERMARMAQTKMDQTEENGPVLTSLRRLTGLHYDDWPLLLLMVGPPGTGKSHAAVRLFMWWTLNVKGSWITEFSVTQRLKFPPPGSSWWSEWDKLVSPPLLLIDDLFTEKTSEADIAYIVELVETRKNNCTPTIVTSNRTIIEIHDLYSVRLAERLLEDTMVMVFSGESKRMYYALRSDDAGSQKVV